MFISIQTPIHLLLSISFFSKMYESSFDAAVTPSRKPLWSTVWDHFSKHSNEQGDTIVKSNLCPTSYKNPNGTSNLWRHFNLVHKSNTSMLQTSLSASGTIIQRQPLSKEQQTKITEKIISVFVDAGLPFSTLKIKNS